jgi:iron complex transport system substrate-binding protein
MDRVPHRSGFTAALATLAVVATILSGCGRQAAPEGPGSTSPSASTATFPLTITDDDGVAVTIASAPQRIVTFAPSMTEIVYGLGLGSRVVGVSGAYDTYPPAASKVERVGGAGDFGVDPNIEKVVSLQPDLFLTIAGGDEWKQRLRHVGVTVVTLNATDFDDLLGDIRTVGRITGAARAADVLTATMAAKEREIQAKVAGEPRVTCFFEAYYPPLTSVGPNTFIFDLLQRAGCDPATAGAKSDYPEWSIDQLVREGPSVYLVASESGVSPAAVAKRPGFSAIAAVHDGNVFLVDSDLVSRPGPRVVDGLMALAADLHPGAFA